MEDLEFYRELEWWASPMTAGSVAALGAFVAMVMKLDDRQRGMLTRYLRSDITYDRFLQTRYWYAIRLKVRADRKRICEICSEERPDVEVHHRIYDHRGEEYAFLSDLKLLCGRCHNMIHEVKVMVEAPEHAGKVH